MPRNSSYSAQDLPPDAFGPPPSKTYPCKTCGRSFVQATLSKHEAICKKTAVKKRKVFESGKQRAAGSDIDFQSVKKVQKEKEKGTFKPPKTHWKEKHDSFVSSIRAAKQVDHAIKTGAPLPPPPKASVPSDYVKCDYCGRNFNKSAAERHIPHCKEQKGRLPPGRNNMTSQQQQQPMKPRTQYQVPKPGGVKTGGAGSAGAKRTTIPQSVNQVPPPNRRMSPVSRTTRGVQNMNIRK